MFSGYIHILLIIKKKKKKEKIGRNPNNNTIKTLVVTLP